MSNLLFNAEISSGHYIKVLVEVLENCFTGEVYFLLDKKGVHVLNTDNKDTILIAVDLLMENFENFKCTQERTIAITIKHMHKLLKSVKKKDSLTLFIDEKMPSKLGIKLIPIFMNKKSEKADTSYITFREITIETPMIPELSCYNQPKVIVASEYQKMCKKMTVVPGKTIFITIQNNDYICFYCDGGGVITSEMTFGTLNENEEFYKGEFYTSTLNQLIKMPGLSNKMQISSPIAKYSDYPIKIRMNVGDIGHIEIYLKTKDTILAEDAKRNSNFS
jgi:proliferating cell nuclear antigen PCNA